MGDNNGHHVPVSVERPLQPRDLLVVDARLPPASGDLNGIEHDELHTFVFEPVIRRRIEHVAEESLSVDRIALAHPALGQHTGDVMIPEYVPDRNAQLLLDDAIERILLKNVLPAAGQAVQDMIAAANGEISAGTVDHLHRHPHAFGRLQIGAEMHVCEKRECEALDRGAGGSIDRARTSCRRSSRCQPEALQEQPAIHRFLSPEQVATGFTPRGGFHCDNRHHCLDLQGMVLALWRQVHSGTLQIASSASAALTSSCDSRVARGLQRAALFGRVLARDAAWPGRDYAHSCLVSCR